MDPGLSPNATFPTGIETALAPGPGSPARVPISPHLQHHVPPVEYSSTSPASVGGPSSLSRQEAFYVHHFTEHLARWLDCTDASRLFALNVIAVAKASPILLSAVISYASSHMRDTVVADQAQQRCVELLIPRLSAENVALDESVLCAIVILRVCEQLSGTHYPLQEQMKIANNALIVTARGSDREQHLAGFNALLKTSQGRQLDPSTPTLSQAAFWVYVRQCLYNACVDQQPPNLDFDLVMIPPLPAAGLVVDVRTETAWANTITWICANVVRFSFGAVYLYPEASIRAQKWLELSESVEVWQQTKPKTFDPIWYGDPDPSGANPFPEIWFTSDWHG
jgi:hypothetical protein